MRGSMNDDYLFSSQCGLAGSDHWAEGGGGDGGRDLERESTQELNTLGQRVRLRVPISTVARSTRFGVAGVVFVNLSVTWASEARCVSPEDHGTLLLGYCSWDKRGSVEPASCRRSLHWRCTS